VKGREMLLDLQRSDFLPPWDEEGTRLLFEEMADSLNKCKDIVGEGKDDYTGSGLSKWHCLFHESQFLFRESYIKIS
jgi:hypothetical protein